MDKFRQVYAKFEKEFTSYEREIAGVQWRWIEGGEGDPVLTLAGATTKARISWMTLSHLAESHHVIAPDYPPIRSMDALMRGIAGLMDSLGIEKFTLMGGSYGGWMAQSMVRYLPERIDKAIITAVGPPNPENSEQLAKLMPVFRLAPLFIIRGLINRSFKRQLAEAEGDPELEFLLGLTKEVMGELTRADFLGLTERLIDQTRNYDFSPGVLADWPGRMLIIAGESDAATTPEKLDRMRGIYPRAEVHMLEGGHDIALSQREAYFALIDEFLDR